MKVEMNKTAQSLIHKAASESAEGRIHFGQVIDLLMQAGVESYAADYRSCRTTYYMPDGATLDVSMSDAAAGIGESFDAGAVVAAIRGAQQGSVMYPDFKRLTMSAGCVGYNVWLAGRHVVYFGRKGESHIERFPA